LTLKFSQEISNSVQMMKGSRDLKIVAFKAAEIVVVVVNVFIKRSLLAFEVTETCNVAEISSIQSSCNNRPVKAGNFIAQFMFFR
jgi:hypothetical protein